MRAKVDGERLVFRMSLDVGGDVRTERRDAQIIGFGIFEGGARHRRSDPFALIRLWHEGMNEGDHVAAFGVGEGGNFSVTEQHLETLLLDVFANFSLFIAHGCGSPAGAFSPASILMVMTFS